MDNRNSDNIRNRDINRDEFNRHDRERDRVIENSGDRTDYNRSDENRRLHFMDDLSDYKVVNEDPDVRGWDVVDVNNRRVGKVEDFLVDTRREKVRYIDVDLDQEIISKDHDPLDNSNVSGVHEYTRDGDVHMIVPIGLARIDEENKRVISDEINRNILEGGHFHRKGDIITPQHERNVINSLRSDRMNEERYSSGSMRSGSFSGSEGREMRRPESSEDTDRSRQSDSWGSESREDRDVNENTRTESYREMRDREPIVRGRSMEDQRMDRRATTDPQTQGPINDEFYDQQFFDDRRFYGRRI